tara:strand:- start:883 stop:1374 length:492 start_codon:yes stop_codon:yes gene_type:complete
MKRLLIGLFLIFNFGFTQIVPDTSKMNMTQKTMWYNNEKKSAARGIFYSSLIPTTGHAYAGNWKRGLIIKGAHLSLLIIRQLVINEMYGEYDGDHYNSNKWKNLSSDGIEPGYPNYNQDLDKIQEMVLLGFYLTYPLELYDVARTVKKYNRQLYKKLFGKYPK